MERKNCWEVMTCGREPGGKHVEEKGICPAAQPGDYDGLNSGEYGGRFCWVVSGTLCNGRVQGTFANKLGDCLKCRFQRQVSEEEGRSFCLTPSNPVQVSHNQSVNPDTGCSSS